MSRPTDWQLLREGDEHYVGSDTISYRGAACYIIGIKRPRERKVRSVYVGHTDDLLERMRGHATWDGTTGDKIETSTRRGFEVYFSYYIAKDKASAEAIEKRLLLKWWDYPWNTLGMPF